MTPDLFGFLADLRVHNDRDWFNAHKERYETAVRDPMLKLVVDVAPALAKVSKAFVADPRPMGGSLSRIYRDTRFSKDKSPYKTALFAHFWHKDGNEDAMPAFYVHVEPGKTTVGGGVWQPPGPALKRIRDTIVKSPADWKKARSGGDLRAACSMSGESLQRVPKPYDPEHPFAEDLKRKDYGLHIAVTDSQFVKDPVGRVEAGMKAAAPLLRFLCKALKLPF